MEYSGLFHFSLWQSSESRFTGSFPVQDAPPMTLRTSGRGAAGASFFSRCFGVFGLLVNTMWSLSGTTGAGAFLGLPLGPWLLFGAIALDVDLVNINDQDTEIIQWKFCMSDRLGERRLGWMNFQLCTRRF
jgi:hypothetical protein